VGGEGAVKRALLIVAAIVLLALLGGGLAYYLHVSHQAREV
jgi:hypothetical protein